MSYSDDVRARNLEALQQLLEEWEKSQPELEALKGLPVVLRAYKMLYEKAAGVDSFYSKREQV